MRCYKWYIWSVDVTSSSRYPTMARLSVRTAWCRAVRPVCPSPSLTSAWPSVTSSLTQLKCPPRTANCSAVKPITDNLAGCSFQQLRYDYLEMLFVTRIILLFCCQTVTIKCSWWFLSSTVLHFFSLLKLCACDAMCESILWTSLPTLHEVDDKNYGWQKYF